MMVIPLGINKLQQVTNKLIKSRDSNRKYLRPLDPDLHLALTEYPGS